MHHLVVGILFKLMTVMRECVARHAVCNFWLRHSFACTPRVCACTFVSLFYTSQDKQQEQTLETDTRRQHEQVIV
jgi:hypothetical protein